MSNKLKAKVYDKKTGEQMFLDGLAENTFLEDGSTVENEINKLKNSNVITEVQNARGSYSILGNRLDNIDLEIEENKSLINDNEIRITENSNLISGNKNDIEELNVKINSLVAGSPKGVYSTVSDLTSAYPSGNENTYVVNADGGWYYWNGTAWILGGIYQDTCIDETNPVIFKIKKDLTNVFGDKPLSAALTTKDGYYFGLTYGDRESRVYKKITFKTELGKIYYISTVIQNNIPLLKLNGVYYPTTTGSDTTLERKSTYVIGDGATISC